MLRQVQLPDPEAVYRRYPHQLSGGMQQRVVLAMALAARPDLLILDEPTTGLDATVEAAILELIAELRQQLGTALLFISHNLAVVAEVCDRVGVLYAGRLVEEGPVESLFGHPAHPYTRGLLACLPRLGARKDVDPLLTIPGQPASAAEAFTGCVFAPRCEFVRETCLTAEPPLIPLVEDDGRVSRCYFAEEVVEAPPPIGAPSERTEVQRPAPTAELQARDLRKTYHSDGATVVAVNGVSLDLPATRTFGLVGESGSGKSTLARVIAGLDPTESGSLAWEGETIEKSVARRPKKWLRELQMVFQDPDSTLNPRQTVRTLLGRSIRQLGRSGGSREERARELLGSVGLDASYLDALPSQLSGGQRQRVAIARAFAGNPGVILCDEPTSALDVSIQATVLNLLNDLQRSEGTAYLFISHDVAVVRYLADVVGVMYQGEMVEVGPAEAVFAAPYHPYTEVLLAAAPRLEGGRATGRARRRPASAAMEATPAASAHPSTGCPFQARCPRKLGRICEDERPPWRETEDGNRILCHIPLEDLAVAQQGLVNG